MILNTSQIITYVLEAAAITLVSRYMLGKTALDRGVLMLMITIAVSHIVMDLFAPLVGTASRQGSGFALGTQLVQGGGGMGLQAGLGMKRSLAGVGHGQTGGAMGLQAALGMKRSLSGQEQIGGMDDRVALDYYGHDRKPTGAVKDPKYAMHGSMIATNGPNLNPSPSSPCDPVPVKQVNVLERFIDDRQALDYYQNDRQPSQDGGCVHEHFVGNLVKELIPQVEAFDGAALNVEQNQTV
jgi:hypothetical protein